MEAIVQGQGRVGVVQAVGFSAQAAVRCPTEAVARPVTSSSRRAACGSSGRCSRPPHAARRVVLVHSGSHAASRPGAPSPTKAPAPCACSPAQMRRAASAFGLHRRRPTRTRVHAKAELRAGRHNGLMGRQRARPEFGDEQVAELLGRDTCSVVVAVMRWTLPGFYGSFRIGGARLVGRALKMPASGDVRNPGMGLGTPSALGGGIGS